jgi:regulator of protease activity HflC (stomatin/prohibitin superfamily)
MREHGAPHPSFTGRGKGTFVFVFAIIFWVIAVVLIAVGLIIRSGWTIGGGVLGALVGFMFLIFSTYYTIDPGEAKVLKNWTGVIVGEQSTPGAHWKEPWVDAIDFDIRNQLEVFLGNGKEQYNGSDTDGPQITFTDKDGVTGNMDLVVLYSIDPGKVVDLVKQYQSQDDFRTKVIEQDIRSVPRDIPGKYTTIQMLTDRAGVANDIKDALEEDWADKGIHIDDVSLQEIRYSDAVKKRFEDAQNAQTEVVKAQAELDKAKIDAQQQVVVAKAQADANNLLSKSLTPQIIQQRYIDMLSKANTIVVPQDFTSLGSGLIPSK